MKKRVKNNCPMKMTNPERTIGLENKTETGQMNNAGTKDAMDFRLEPEKRMCPKFDDTSIAIFSVADREEMGVRVVDNCAEEHIM